MCVQAACDALGYLAVKMMNTNVDHCKGCDRNHYFGQAEAEASLIGVYGAAKPSNPSNGIIGYRLIDVVREDKRYPGRVREKK